MLLAGAVFLTAALGAFSPVAQAADAVYSVYFTSGGTLYRKRTDGAGGVEQLGTNTRTGDRCKRSGSFLFGKGGDQLLRTDLSKVPYAQASSAAMGIGGFDVKGDYVYFTRKAPDSSRYRLYRMRADVDPSKTGYSGSRAFQEFDEEVATNLEYNYLDFKMLDDRIYYTAKKDGRELWVASKKEDGSGSVRWIAKGALESRQLTTTTADNIYITVNTNPEETQYSTECYVVYKVPRKGGKATALNKKYPVDANAALSGGWAGSVYYYNKGTKMQRYENSFEEYLDYSGASGYGIDMARHRMTIDEKGAVEMANTTGNTYVYCNSKGEAYSCTISGGKISNRKKLEVSGVRYVRNLKKNGKRASTLLAGSSGTYMLNDSDMSVKKMIGVNWDIVYLFDDIDGLLYLNAGDESRLYWLSADGKTNRRLSDSEPSSVPFVEKVS